MTRMIALLLALILAAVTVTTAESPPLPKSAALSDEERDIVAVLEILELMAIVEEIEMVQEMNHLIEEDLNENPSD